MFCGNSVNIAYETTQHAYTTYDEGKFKKRRVLARRVVVVDLDRGGPRSPSLAGSSASPRGVVDALRVRVCLLGRLSVVF